MISMEMSAEKDRPTPHMRPADEPSCEPLTGSAAWHRNTHTAPTGTFWESPQMSTPTEKYNA